MSLAKVTDFRRVILDIIAKKAKGYFTAKSILEEAAEELGIAPNDSDKGQALLTFFYDLFRNGQISWGVDIANYDFEWCHLTDRGRETLKNVSRDPSNADGYLACLDKMMVLDPVARSYLVEALHTYNSNCFKASAVMIGAAAERLILRLRDTLETCLTAKGKPLPAGLTDWKIKTVRDVLAKELEAHKKAMPKDVAEPFTAYWLAFAEQIRRVRNDAGHPESIDPVTPESVQAALLIFPELAKLESDLETWVNSFF